LPLFRFRKPRLVPLDAQNAPNIIPLVSEIEIQQTAIEEHRVPRLQLGPDENVPHPVLNECLGGGETVRPRGECAIGAGGCVNSEAQVVRRQTVDVVEDVGGVDADVVVGAVT